MTGTPAKVKVLAVLLFPFVAAGVAVAIFLAVRSERRTRAFRARLAKLAAAERETWGDPW